MNLPTAMNQLILTVLQGAGLLVLIAVISGSLRRTTLNPLKQSLMLGALFGLTALLLETLSDNARPGLMLDGRFMASALAAAFGGMPALSMAIAINALGRGWPTDLAGFINIVGPIITGFVALCWRWQVKPRIGNVFSSLVTLGLMLAVPLVMLHSLSSNEVRPPPFLFWGGGTAAAVLLTLMIGISLEREQAILLREQALLKTSLRDPLTGLHNRRSFDVELAKIISRPGDHYLLYIDVDHFKKVNDKYGHSFGDEVLRVISQTMIFSVRKDDIVARIGGEEFAIILSNIFRVDAEKMAERLLTEVPKCDLWFSGGRVTITISIGVARRANHSAITLMSVADSALYRAKSLGRQRAVFCTEHMFDQGSLLEPANDTLGREEKVN